MTQATLTAREVQVVALIAGGLRDEQIGAQLGCTTLTVRTHVRNITRKLGIDTRAGVVAWAIRAQLIN